MTGNLYGLILELYLGDPKKETFYEFNDGVLISIHNQSTIPFTQGEKIKAAAGLETDLIMSRNFISKLEKPHGDCLKDTTSSSTFSSDYFDYIVRTIGETYSQEYCYALCVQKHIIDTCNCSNTLMPIFNGTTHFCVNFNIEVACMKKLIFNFGSTKGATDCKAFCPYECESVEYGVTTYKALYPNEFYTDILYAWIKGNGVNISIDSIDKAFAKVNIFYKSMEYTSTTQNIQTSADDLFSNIGGTLGLYVGVSILSAVEIVELGFNLIMALISYLKSRKQIKSVLIN